MKKEGLVASMLAIGLKLSMMSATDNSNIGDPFDIQIEHYII